jgi:hypothetical protein
MISISQEINSLSQQASSFQGLVYGVFQGPMLAASNGGLAIALVAAHPGAGTTYLTTVLTRSLTRDRDVSTASLDCREIANSSDGVEAGGATDIDGQGISTLPALRGNWRGNRDYRAGYIAQFRSRYSYVLIDCPSLKESADILGLSGLVDGVLLVIEANKTSKSQIAHLERTIEGAGGKILGHLLNKRTYPIPEWANGPLVRWGF